MKQMQEPLCARREAFQAHTRNHFIVFIIRRSESLAILNRRSGDERVSERYRMAQRVLLDIEHSPGRYILVQMYDADAPAVDVLLEYTHFGLASHALHKLHIGNHRDRERQIGIDEAFCGLITA